MSLLSFINPGSGPVDSATLEHAIVNVRHFIVDCGVEGVEVLRMPSSDFDGRFGFLIWKNTRCHSIKMPGLPLEQVRFMDNPGQDAWHFPRLLMDGSSWLWKFAILDEKDFADPVRD